ncbi:MAG: cysteine synthase A [Armatimonadetes bacterium]|nr:cysteine synthase A [Armatimonadota bacterium]NIM23095.1 cysteine synthase A [Armatimonadota bacterium]NIM66963.1 cysteine synthase A [Armatimonadota bacterium]NIM75497.1 cysteine synthase A [Armatimonadota bacterium]NIN05154.1 cysteine synthase A [Armatimonadota bacterium]
MLTGKVAGTQTIVNNVLELVGNTPLVRLNHLPDSDSAEVLAKLEAFNPGWSVKDRIALSMIEAAEKEGLLKPGGTIIEPTSGNTGIGLAMVAAVKGYRCILTMPESMSLERRFAVESFGAEIVLTPASEGMNGTVVKAEEILANTPGAFMPQQFKNPANPEIHRRATAREILEATEGKLDAFVGGIGTGGTITGVGEVLRKESKKTMIVAVEPSASPLLSEGKAAPHKIQGIGANFVPEILNREVIDRIITVADEDAFRTSRQLAKKEGIFVGISAGAACWAALQVAKELGAGKRVVVVLPDLGDRYASMAEHFRV